jgi:hypothetical protein
MRSLSRKTSCTGIDMLMQHLRPALTSKFNEFIQQQLHIIWAAADFFIERQRIAAIRWDFEPAQRALPLSAYGAFEKAQRWKGHSHETSKGQK